MKKKIWKNFGKIFFSIFFSLYTSKNTGFWSSSRAKNGGEKISFFEKTMKKKFWKNFGKKFVFDFFNIINAKCGQQSIFSDKITILSYKTIFGPAFSLISENLVE